MNDRNSIFYERHAEHHRQELMRAAENARRAKLAMDNEKKPQWLFLPALRKQMRAVVAKVEACWVQQPPLKRQAR